MRLDPFDETLYGICPECSCVVRHQDSQLHQMGHIMGKALQEKQAEDRAAWKANTLALGLLTVSAGSATETVHQAPERCRQNVGGRHNGY